MILVAAAPAGARPLTPAPPTQQQTQAAQDACKAQGLTPATDPFRQRVGKQLAQSAGGGQAPPQGGQAPSGPPPPGADACKAKGLKPGTDDFNACIKAAAAAHPSQTGTAAQ
ncbi:MAG TPA: hypothetical protein VKP14_00065 [Gaiellaceae bacterium]|nr:hypothetical protein [Gaiellaceae bacterium]